MFNSLAFFFISPLTPDTSHPINDKTNNRRSGASKKKPSSRPLGREKRVKEEREKGIEVVVKQEEEVVLFHFFLSPRNRKAKRLPKSCSFSHSLVFYSAFQWSLLRAEVSRTEPPR